MSRLRPFWSYFGGKWRSAPHYPKPNHRRVVEPFAGAAGYSTLHHSSDVVLVDSDPIIASLWAWLIKASSEEILRLPLDIPHTINDLGLAPEPSALIGFWVNPGAAKPRQRPSSWMRKDPLKSSYWNAKTRDMLAGQVGAIRHWTVINASYGEADIGPATYFVDPPYERAGRHYRHHKIDYPALGRWCRSLQGQVMVCEEQGATWLPFRPHGEFQSNTSSKGRKKVKEAIWTSEPGSGTLGADADDLFRY